MTVTVGEDSSEVGNGDWVIISVTSGTVAGAGLGVKREGTKVPGEQAASPAMTMKNAD